MLVYQLLNEIHPKHIMNPQALMRNCNTAQQTNQTDFLFKLEKEISFGGLVFSEVYNL